MSNPESQRKIHTNWARAEKKNVEGIAQSHPEWVDEKGECQACTSLNFEMADPSHVPKEVMEELKKEN